MSRPGYQPVVGLSASGGRACGQAIGERWSGLRPGRQRVVAGLAAMPLAGYSPPMSSATLVPISAMTARPKLMMTLLAAQVCGSTGNTLTLAMGSIVAADLTGSNTLTGVPVAVGALGGALASVPLSRLMGRAGRRPGLALGYALAVLGSVLSMIGVGERSFPIFLAGMFLFGFGQTSGLLGRFAAADISTVDQRGRAIGLIVGGATAGSIVGPNLMAPATTLGGWLGVPTVGGPFLIGIGGFWGGGPLLRNPFWAGPLGVGAPPPPPPPTRGGGRAGPPF